MCLYQKIGARELVKILKNQGILIDYSIEENFRMVTHKDIESKGVMKAINCFKKIEKHLEHK